MARGFNERIEADAFVPTGQNVPPEPGLYKKRDDVLGVHGVAEFDEIPVTDASCWWDLTCSLTNAGVAAQNIPTPTAFGPVHTPRREENAYAIGDYQFCDPFHINHNIKPGGRALFHVHWSSDGISEDPVNWEFSILRALGHDQANFDTVITKTIQQNGAGSAWRHMIAEVDLADALVLVEPDELILVTVRRVAADGTDNTDAIFGLTVDAHIEIDRAGTPNRAPNFYGE